MATKTGPTKPLTRAHVFMPVWCERTHRSLKFHVFSSESVYRRILDLLGCFGAFLAQLVEQHQQHHTLYIWTCRLMWFHFETFILLGF